MLFLKSSNLRFNQLVRSVTLRQSNTALTKWNKAQAQACMFTGYNENLLGKVTEIG